MPRVPLEIATGFYQSESTPLAAQRCINFIPVVPQASALNQRALIGTPGIKQITTTGPTIVGANRGSMRVKGVYYTINGDSLYSVSGSNAVNKIGNVTGQGRVSLANNGVYLVIVVPKGAAYAYNVDTKAFTQIGDVDFRTSDTVVFIDGYFVFTASDGTVFFNSALNDPLTYDALDFGTAEINPDRIVAAHVNHNELFILGEETIEIFDNVGGTGFPFARIDGANIQKGVHAKFTPVEFDNTFMFVGGGLNERSAVWKVNNSNSASKVSTSAIDNAIQEFTRDEISNAFAITYAEDGNYFAVFTFESTRIPSRTFVYDATASALSGASVWHERQTGVTDDRWRVNSITAVNNRLIVGDQIDGRLGELDKKTFTEYGNMIFRSKSSAPFSARGLPQFWGEMQLTMESGVGLTLGQGSNPQIRYDFSDDGGRTYSSEFSRTYGKIGEYNAVPTWRRQGRIPKHRVVRFTTTEPVLNNILKLEATVEPGSQ